MPKINGWELLEEFSKLNPGFKPFIVVLTTSMSPSDEKKANELLKIDFFTTKPLTIEKIQAILSHRIAAS